MNPRLHLAMHEIVASQLWDDDPPQAWQAAQRLLDQGEDRHDILHALGEVAMRSVHGALTTQEPVDAAEYGRALDVLGRGGGRRGGGGRSRRSTARPARLATGAASAAAYQVKIGIRGAEPPIWRRLRVPAGITLAELHHVIQAAFGWQDCHLHHFLDGDDRRRRFAPADYESWGDAPEDEARVRLRDLVTQAGDRLLYEYDFGDSWHHDMVVEEVLADAAADTVVCLAGRRAGPIEDSGGIWGHAYLCEVMADPGHPEHAERRSWLRDVVGIRHFDPSAFDKDTVNDALTAIPVGATRR